MTAKKPKPVKPGPKTQAKVTKVDKTLLDLYNEDGISYSHAAELAGCGRAYASKKFKEFGDRLVNEDAEKHESWVETNTRVRKRALEGLSRHIEDADKRIKDAIDRFKKAKDIQAEILPETANKLEDSELSQALSKINSKTIFAIFKIISQDLNMHKNYGYFVEQIGKNLKDEILFKAELQQQYDTIEILPPASEILDREIEKRIAVKQGLIQKPAEVLLEEAKKKK